MTGLRFTYEVLVERRLLRLEIYHPLSSTLNLRQSFETRVSGRKRSSLWPCFEVLHGFRLSCVGTSFHPIVDFDPITVCAMRRGLAVFSGWAIFCVWTPGSWLARTRFLGTGFAGLFSRRGIHGEGDSEENFFLAESHLDVMSSLVYANAENA